MNRDKEIKCKLLKEYILERWLTSFRLGEGYLYVVDYKEPFNKENIIVDILYLFVPDYNDSWKLERIELDYEQYSEWEYKQLNPPIKHVKEIKQYKSNQEAFTDYPDRI